MEGFEVVEDDEPGARAERKRCPDCRELILRAAYVCKHCGWGKRQADPPQVIVKGWGGPGLATLVALAALCVGACFFLSVLGHMGR